MENEPQESIEREKKPSLLERFGRYLAEREGRMINKSLTDKGFGRTKDLAEGIPLQKLIDECQRYNAEIYIAPGILFGEPERKYVIYMRTERDRERQIERGERI